MRFALISATILTGFVLAVSLFAVRLTLVAAAIATAFYGYEPPAQYLNAAILMAAAGMFNSTSVTYRQEAKK